MTINQALDKLTDKKDLNLYQQDLKVSLIKLRSKHGGRTKIDNYEEVENLIEHGNKEGKETEKDS